MIGVVSSVSHAAWTYMLWLNAATAKRVGQSSDEHVRRPPDDGGAGADAHRRRHRRYRVELRQTRGDTAGPRRSTDLHLPDPAQLVRRAVVDRLQERQDWKHHVHQQSVRYHRKERISLLSARLSVRTRLRSVGMQSSHHSGIVIFPYILSYSGAVELLIGLKE